MSEVEKEVLNASLEQAGDAANTSQDNANELDYKTLYFDSLKQIEKTSEERDNYKKGLLAAKGKATVEDDVKVKNELIGKLNYLEEELKSLKNSQGANIGSSTSQVKGVDTPTNGWSAEQIKQLQVRGINPDKAWINYQKHITK